MSFGNFAEILREFSKKELTKKSRDPVVIPITIHYNDFS